MKRLLALIGMVMPATAYAVKLTDFVDCNKLMVLHCGEEDAIALVMERIINGVYAFIVAVCVAAFLYGAIRMIISEGAEGKEAGKKAMIWAAVGLAFAVLTYNGNQIIQFVVDLLYSFA